MSNGDDLVERVRDARKEQGLTQQQLADKAGVSLRTYQNFEGRVGSPQGGNLRAILNAVGIDATSEETAEATRESWPADIRVFLDMVGAYLATMTEDDRESWMYAATRQIFENRILTRP